LTAIIIYRYFAVVTFGAVILAKNCRLRKRLCLHECVVCCVLVANWTSTGHWRAVAEVSVWKPRHGWFVSHFSVIGINRQVSISFAVKHMCQFLLVQ